jgi:hypothetical protein
MENNKVNRGAGARPANAVEDPVSFVQRSVVDNYNKVSRKYLSQYVTEFRIRYNNCGNPNIFAEAVHGC